MIPNLNKQLIILLFLTALFGCNFINPDEPVPAYIEIPQIKLTHENGIGIQDAWVYIDGNIIGVYEVPTTFPVIASGETNIMVIPGIKVNGTNETRAAYPFYEPYKITVNLTPSKIKTINPETTYGTWADIAFAENFESNIKFTNADTTDALFQTTSNDAIQGFQSGYLKLDANHLTFSIESNPFDIPSASGDNGMFLEFNFKTKTPVYVGYRIYSDAGEVINNTEYMILLPPKENWTKLYVDLYNPTVGYFYRGTQMSIVFENTNTDILHIEDAEFLLDDVKIVY